MNGIYINKNELKEEIFKNFGQLKYIIKTKNLSEVKLKKILNLLDDILQETLTKESSRMPIGKGQKPR